MAATARSSAPSDARIACPQCGGVIHPIAGRCKHCKADLAALRGARPAAAAALPSLAVVTPGKPARSPMGAVTSAASASPRAVSFDQDREPVSILPPRQTGSHHAVDEEDGTRWWKSWPVVVIVLASLAIVAAIIMLIVPSKKDDGHLIEPPGPAPDRMNTNPLTEPHANNGGTPGTAPDPWAGSAKPTDPGANGGRPPPPDPLPPITPDDDDLGGVFGGIGGGTVGPNATGLATGALLHACARLKACNPDDDTLTTMCTVAGTTMKTKPPTCAAATRCFATIDAMSCDDIDVSKIPTMMTTLTDCADALRC
ncbi:MAG: hypothetical protein NT062_21640 [Proteobacteria bacterium]|nr:hypothetical protein [Pseudomonadota bacterium]